MSESLIGIVGGYGATGRVVVAELLKSGVGNLLAGGRDPAKLESLASEFGSRVSAARLDVLEERSLDEFCSRCSTIVNCGGPVMLLQDRVAQAALRRHCHYLDLAGMSVVKERMLPHSKEITELGLSFVVSAGWMPGLTEVLPVYAHAQARAKMESVETLDVYFSDSGEWSDNAMRDGVQFLRRTGLARPGFFRKGEWVRAQLSEASRTLDLEDPVGLRRFGLYTLPELNEAGRRLTDCDVRSYSYLAGLRNALAAILLAGLPLPGGLGVRLLRDVFRRNRLPVGGFVVAHVLGRSAGRSAALKVRIAFETGREYWINGIVLATAVRMTQAGDSVQPGVHFLYDAVDPITFMAELRKAGVPQTETLEVCGSCGPSGGRL